MTQKFLLPLVAFAAFSLIPFLRADEPAPVVAPRVVVDEAWPPLLENSVNGIATIETDEFLVVPENVKAAMQKPGVMQFVMAKKTPRVELAYHRDLPNRALNGTGWSAWGDIAVASDGKVYSGIGDHGNNNGGGHAYVYCWDPATKTLKQIANANLAAGAGKGDVTWSKVHARIVEGKDGKIYFTCTLNNGALAFQSKWTERVPGGQIFQYDPATGKTIVVGAIPGEVTPTTILDRERNILYLNMEGKTAASDVALTAFDLTTNKIVYQSPHDAVTGSRNLALARNGAVYFSGKDGI